MIWYTVSPQADSSYYTEVFWIKYNRFYLNFLTFNETLTNLEIEDSSLFYEHK